MRIGFLADEITHIYDGPGSFSDRNVEIAERKVSLSQWQQRWIWVEKSRWTNRLIPSIKSCKQRTRGGINYTQFLAGHGKYRR